LKIKLERNFTRWRNWRTETRSEKENRGAGHVLLSSEKKNRGADHVLLSSEKENRGADHVLLYFYDFHFENNPSPRLISFLHEPSRPSWVLSFFLCKFMLFSFIIMPDFWSYNHVFIASFQREQLVLHGHNYGRKERSCTTLWLMETNCWNQNRNQNILVFFLRFCMQNHQGFAS